MISALLDRALTVAAARAGAPGGLRYTERQLYYELCRVLQPLHAGPRRIPYTLAPPVRYARFARLLAERSGQLDGLLGPLAPSAELPPAADDLYDYGLPRLLVCQSPEIARMLLANDLHLELACPIVTGGQLPLDRRLVAALRRDDQAVVHVLHDASPTGLELFARVGATHRSGTGPRVRSLGLVPRHAAALHLTSERGPARPTGPLPPGLRPAEQAWLAGGRTAELAAVNPARLLHAVIRQVRAGGARPRRAPLHHRLRRARTTGFLTWPTT